MVLDSQVRRKELIMAKSVAKKVAPQEITFAGINDLPEEFLNPTDQQTVSGNWAQSLKSWADQELSLGHSGILQQATPIFEKCMIEVALKHSGGRKRDAAELLGWGRNTLTRKIKELGIENGSAADTD